jgi:hypothetical protein
MASEKLTKILEFISLEETALFGNRASSNIKMKKKFGNAVYLRASNLSLSVQEGYVLSIFNSSSHFGCKVFEHQAPCAAVPQDRRCDFNTVCDPVTSNTLKVCISQMST